MFSLFQQANGDLHLPSLLMFLGWVAGSAVTAIFMFANLKVNRDDRLKASDAAKIAASRIDELETNQKPRKLTEEQTQIIISNLRGIPPAGIAFAGSSFHQETKDFAKLLKEAVSQTEWKAFIIETLDMKPGIRVQRTEDVSDEQFQAVLNALVLCGLPAKEDPFNGGSQHVQKIQPGGIYVVIGPRQ